MLSSRNEATNLTNDIIMNFGRNNINEISNNCNNLIKHLFSHQYLLYTDLNAYFESSGLIRILIISLERMQESSKRDVLRLMHLIIQVNRSLRTQARQNGDFQSYIQKTLDHTDNWENRIKFKHHINIGSQLLADREAINCSFNTLSVRKTVRNIIDNIIKMNQQENDDILPIIIFYACSMFNSTFEEIPNVREDVVASEKIITKEVAGKCIDIIRDYIKDFKVFYESDSEIDRSSFVLYKPKSEFSFQQMCNTVIYYSVQSEVIRMNIFQSGIYEVINNLFSIKNTPEPLLLCGVDILKLPLLDEIILKGIKNGIFKPIKEKLKNIFKRALLSEEMAMSIQHLLRLYETPKDLSFDLPTGDIINSPRKLENSVWSFSNNTMYNKESSSSFDFEKWDESDVQIWLTNNHLQGLKETFSHLTGRGLKQLQSLAKEVDKMEFISFIIEKVGLRFDMSLELISALKNL